jgi:hypothetical protein
MGWQVAPQDPTLTGWQNDVFGSTATKSKAGKWSKKFLTKLGEGADVSDYGELAGVRSREANAQAGVGMDYLTGANALLANSGNADDIGQMNRQRDLQREKIHDQAGREEIDALGNLTGTAASINAGENQFRNQFEQQGKIAAMGNRLQDYQSRLKYTTPFWQSALLAGISGASAVGGAFAGRPPSCWIAEALFGADDPRTHLLRFWINQVWARESILGCIFAYLYSRFGERLARVVKRNRALRGLALIVFRRLLKKAYAAMPDNPQGAVSGTL